MIWPTFTSLLSHWSGDKEELVYFATITDEPPAKVAEAGQDRCIVPVKPKTWSRDRARIPRICRRCTPC